MFNFRFWLFDIIFEIFLLRFCVLRNFAELCVSSVELRDSMVHVSAVSLAFVSEV